MKQRFPTKPKTEWITKKEELMSWYLTVLLKYAVFSGRAQRAEFWMFSLFSLIVSIILRIIDAVLLLDLASGISILSTVYALAVLIPGTAVGIRRLHDVDRNGWFILLVFIPIVGWIWLLILFVREGTPGENQYGSNPKAITG